MSRSVSAPSSVTKTSPCWNGLIVPGSTLRYGSNFCSCTRRPRALRSRPSDAATMPFPSAETTPPVTKTYFGARALTGFQGSTRCGRSLFRGRGDERGDELLPAEHPPELGLPLLGAELLDPRVRGVAGGLLHAEVPVGECRDLREVCDRDDLGVLGEAPEQSPDGVGRLAAHAGVDLVEDERVPSGHGRKRERDPRELAAGGSLRDRREGKARVRADEEDGLVGPRGTGLGALAELADELAVAHADAAQLGGNRIRERRSRRVPLGAQLEAERPDTFFGRRELARGDLGRIRALFERSELGQRLLAPRQQLLVRRAAEAALRLGDPVEIPLELLEAPRLGLQRGEKTVQIGCRLAQAQLDVA